MLHISLLVNWSIVFDRHTSSRTSLDFNEHKSSKSVNFCVHPSVITPHSLYETGVLEVVVVNPKRNSGKETDFWKSYMDWLENKILSSTISVGVFKSFNYSFLKSNLCWAGQWCH